ISYPIHTIIVNIIGCFFIGFIATQVLKFNNPDNVRLFVIMGVLGGFTTFSSYSFEVMQMFKNRMFAQALLYFLGSNTLCICAAYLGYSIKL
ncbi:MAG: fluoride efflux transporter CrcB, partial [Bacteroidetes bacterium]|nr:fluoride efflux transporter CrcB [Bacteroidota bacterium]